jgi:hypothetical protein
MASATEAVAILNKLVEELRGRQTDIETYDDAYRGNHKLQFASEDFREFFAKRYDKFSDNWCGIVADAPHERLEIVGFRLDGEMSGDAELWRTWRETNSDAGSDLAFLDSIIMGRAFALVWGDTEDRPQITWEHASQCIVSYDPETRARSAGAKVWADDDREFATLYLPDEVWKFQRPRVTSELILPAHLLEGSWEPRQPAGDNSWPLPNPLGRVPLVEFTNRPRLRGEPMSDIKGALSMQHAINLLWSQLFVAVDNVMWPQRVIYGGEMPTIPILDEQGNEVGERPIDLKKFAMDRAIWLEDPNIKIGEWGAAKGEAWTSIIEIGVGHVAAQSRTPAHYMLIGGTIANVPEGGLKALETGLAQRTKEKTQHLGRSARDVNELVALVEGNAGKASAIRRGETLWRDVENRSDAQRADALQKKKDVGYPLRYLLELDGLPPQEIERVMEMRREEAADPIAETLLRNAGVLPGDAGA